MCIKYLIFFKIFALLIGLNLELNIQQDEYLGAFTEEAGVRIDISNQGEMPFPREKGLSAAPGFSTSIGMRKVSVIKFLARRSRAQNYPWTPNQPEMCAATLSHHIKTVT